MTNDDPSARAFVDLRITVEDDDHDTIVRKEADSVAGVDVNLPLGKRLQTATISVDVTDVEIVPTDDDGDAVRAPTSEDSTDLRKRALRATYDDLPTDDRGDDGD